MANIIKDIAGSILNRPLERLKGAGITGNPGITKSRAKWSGRNSGTDWRVRLAVPEQSPLYGFFFNNNDLLAPLKDSSGFFWPLTPSMVIQHSADYNALEQVHSNYPHYAYQNSRVDQLNIIGEFPVQNDQDARYWVAVINFLRTATKMFFGQEDQYGLKGSPPPILHLYGYGDHMFHKVPVVLNTFNVELRAGIDYISTKQNTSAINPVYKQGGGYEADEFTNLNREVQQTWAPTLSNISVLVSPIFSRDDVKTFSMEKFVRGELNGKGSNEVGFI